MNESRSNGRNGNGHDKTNGQGPVEIKDLLSYPARVYIKAVGHHSTRFEAVVHSIVSKYIAPADLLATSTRVSRGGKYLAVTLTINANSRTQLDDIYRDLSACEDVLIAL